MRGLGWLALLAAGAAALLALLPVEPAFLDLTLDGSFAATLHHAAATPGTQLISTYGPLGFLHYATYLPPTWPWLVAGQSLLGAVLCATVAWIGWAACASPWGGALALAATVPLLGNADTRWLAVPALAIFIDLPAGRRPPPALRLALGAAIGALCLVKVTFLVAAAFILTPLALRELRQRRIPATALSALAAVVLLWLAAGRGGGDAVAFLDWGVRDITAGYAQAMQLPTRPAPVAYAALVSVAILIAGAWLARRRVGSGWWLYALALAAWLFLLFKAGFVRADVHHQVITALGLVFAGVLLAALCGPRPASVALAALVLVLPPAGLYRHLTHAEAPGRLFTALTPADLWRRAGAAPEMLLGDAGAALDRDARRKLTNGQTALPPLAGPVDFVSYLQAVPLAHGVSLRPRPVFQSYMAYTPRLARANAAYFAGPQAPHWLILWLRAIDGRLPALEDGAAWPELLTRYQFSSFTPAFTLLERRAAPRAWRLTPLGTVATTTGAPIAVPSPAGGPVWARIDVGDTLGDRLGTALLSAPILFLEVALANGVATRYRMVAAVARDGFLLSPLISSNNEFVALLQDGVEPLAALGVTRIVVSGMTPFATPLPPRPVTVEFLRLEIDG